MFKRVGVCLLLVGCAYKVPEYRMPPLAYSESLRPVVVVPGGGRVGEVSPPVPPLQVKVPLILPDRDLPPASAVGEGVHLEGEQ